jgi:hypothetical protein
VVWSAKAQLSLFHAEAKLRRSTSNLQTPKRSFGARRTHLGAEAAASAEEGRKLRLRTPHGAPLDQRNLTACFGL